MRTLLGFVVGAYLYNKDFQNQVNKTVKKCYDYLDKELNKKNKENNNDNGNK